MPRGPGIRSSVVTNRKGERVRVSLRGRNIIEVKNLATREKFSRSGQAPKSR